MGESKTASKRAKAAGWDGGWCLVHLPLENAFYKHASRNIPKPIDWGSFRLNEKLWCYLAEEYHDMIGKVFSSHSQEFVSIVLDIHQKSMGNPLKDKFNFDVPTHLANIACDNNWEQTSGKNFHAGSEKNTKAGRAILRQE